MRGFVRHGAVAIGWGDAASADRRASGNALISAVAASLGVDVGPPARRCPICGSHEHGVPEIAGGRLVASLSYADDIVVAAVARREDGAAVGVDVERADRSTGDLAALFAAHAIPDIEQWTRIEAVLKASGRGIRISPSTIDVSGPVAHLGESSFDLATVAGPEGYVVSVAAAAPSAARPSRVRRGR